MIHDILKKLDNHHDRIDTIETTEIEAKLNTITTGLVNRAVAEIIHPIHTKHQADLDLLKKSSAQYKDKIEETEETLSGVLDQL